jgi:GNAT superfamily N-acetyltransferase
MAVIEVRRHANIIDAVLLEPEEGEDWLICGLAFYYERSGVWAVTGPVREKYRQQGVEARIIAELLTLSGDHDIELTVTQFAENPFPENYLRQVYEALGFRETGKPKRTSEFNGIEYNMVRPANQPHKTERSSA